MEAEEKRLKKEMEEREKQRAEQEHRNIRRKEAEKRIEQLKTTDIGVRALEGLTEEVGCRQVHTVMRRATIGQLMIFRHPLASYPR